MNSISEHDAFELSEAEVHQAMIMNRMESSFLKELLGLISTSSSVAPLMLFAERSRHASGTLSQYLGDLGETEMHRIRDLAHEVLCEEWGYCHRRASEGLGDPRHFIRIIARLVGPRLGELGIPTSRALLIACSVVLSRMPLSELCHCEGRAHRVQ